MRKSKVLKKLREGKVAVSFKTNLSDSRACEIAAMSGFDCIWACMEHVPNDMSVMERQVLACKAYDTDIVVRVERGSYSDYIRPLEMDATGIMIPHLMGVEDARNIAKMTRFHPIGLRALDAGNADGGFCTLALDEYIAYSNNEKLVIVQIEDPEPLEELEEICQVDGIDMIFYGPADYSQALGIPGQFDDPRIDQARKYIADTARKYNKFAGTVGSVNNFEKLVGMGYTFINVGADVYGLGKYCRDIVSRTNV